MALGACVALLPTTGLLVRAASQTPAAAAVPARQSGTVKSIDGMTLTVLTAAGPMTVPVAADAPVLQLAPDVKDLKTAQPIKFSDIVVGDRVLTGKNGDSATASRVIVIKAGDIAARNQLEQADWQKRGTSGLVKAIDGPVLTVSAGAKTVKVDTASSTVFRRYAPDSVKFQDAKPGALPQIHTGDQMSVRGNKSEDGLTITADEVVTGSFSNLSGAVSSVDPLGGTITLKDLTTKKTVVVAVTDKSDVRKLPAQAAATFAARNTPGAGGVAGGPPAGGFGGGAGAPGAGGPGAGGGPGGPGGAGAGRARAGMDLSRMLARLPQGTLIDLKPNDAVMIVATPGSQPGAFTAITVLSGVEQLLSAPGGAAPITLSPWNIGGGGEGGGGGPQ